MDWPPLPSTSAVPWTETDLATAAPTSPSADSPAAPSAPSQSEIRDFAYDLYQRSGCLPGRDLANWLSASERLSALLPPPVLASESPSPDPNRFIPEPHALGDQAGRAAYLPGAGSSSAPFSPTVLAAEPALPTSF